MLKPICDTFASFVVIILHYAKYPKYILFLYNIPNLNLEIYCNFCLAAFKAGISISN